MKGSCLCMINFLIIVINILRQYETLGTCSRNERYKSNIGIIYYIQYFCCDNYEDYRDNCRECPVGFTSKGGFECSPCKTNSYGTKCAGHCKCRGNERCDHVQGCIQFNDTNSAGESKENMGTTFTENDTTHRSSNDVGKEETSKVLLIGLVIGICLILFIGCLVIVCCKHKLTKRKHKLVVLTDTPTLQSIVSNVSQTGNEQIEIHEYEEIDEEILNRESSIVHRNDNTRRISNKGISVNCGTDDDGYLLPYHSISLSRRQDKHDS